MEKKRCVCACQRVAWLYALVFVRFFRQLTEMIWSSKEERELLEKQMAEGQKANGTTLLCVNRSSQNMLRMFSTYYVRIMIISVSMPYILDCRYSLNADSACCPQIHSVSYLSYCLTNWNHLLFRAAIKEDATRQHPQMSLRMGSHTGLPTNTGNEKFRWWFSWIISAAISFSLSLYPGVEIPSPGLVATVHFPRLSLCDKSGLDDFS